MPKPIAPITPPPEPQAATEAAPQAAPAQAEASARTLEEPSAGGRYLRDPVTGALTPNPD